MVKSVVLLGLLFGPAALRAGQPDEDVLEAARRFEDQLQQWQTRALAGEAEAVLAELAALPDRAERDPRVHNVRGLAWSALGRPEEAIVHFEAGIELGPDRPELHFNLAAALLELGRTGRALAEFEQTLELDPDSVEARLGLGRGLLRLRRLPAAVEVLEAAAVRAPEDPRVLRALAEACEANGDRDAAQARWSLLDRLAPSADSARRLGELARLEAPERARDHFAACLQRDSTAIDCAEALGALALDAGDLGTARAVLEPRLASISEIGLVNLLMVYNRIGDVAATAALLESREPTSGAAWGVVALGLRTAGNRAGAFAAVRRGLDLEPDDADLHNLLGVLHEEAGDRAAARAAWERALAYDPEHAEARANLGATRRQP